MNSLNRSYSASSFTSLNDGFSSPYILSYNKVYCVCSAKEMRKRDCNVVLINSQKIPSKERLCMFGREVKCFTKLRRLFFCGLLQPKYTFYLLNRFIKVLFEAIWHSSAHYRSQGGRLAVTNTIHPHNTPVDQSGYLLRPMSLVQISTTGTERYFYVPLTKFRRFVCAA
ncbi:unnamed protein product [Albugo candida]|uniref:Uncharacterized protein n=1 Tax=Albugo candida TaxID=65357 RepID=A0A024FTU7_9STRA|nr:unnamed protein product [Albugo candida]|eukprot:CCI10558.1 unnamed protein product [Albugo candida]